MVICPKYEEHINVGEEFIGSLGANYTATCNIKVCPYNNLDENTNICKTQGLLKKFDVLSEIEK